MGINECKNCQPVIDCEISALAAFSGLMEMADVAGTFRGVFGPGFEM